jgi:chromosome segregation ATPase
MLTTLHAEAKLNAQARMEQAEAKLADAERATKQLRDQEEAAQRKLDGESRQRVAMAEKVAAAQQEAQQAIGEAEHQSKLREQASAEVSRLQAALSDVQGKLSMRTEQLQSLEARRQRELQQEAEQTAKAQAAAQSAAKAGIRPTASNGASIDDVVQAAADNTIQGLRDDQQQQMAAMLASSQTFSSSSYLHLTKHRLMS